MKLRSEMRAEEKASIGTLAVAAKSTKYSRRGTFVTFA